MTDQEWLACTDPKPTLEFLRGKVSDRKLRLFAVGRCRLLWNRITFEEIKLLVDLAEERADSQATEQEWLKAFHSVPAVAFTRYVAWPDASTAACNVSEGWVRITDGGRRRRMQVRLHVERPAQCELLRELLGNPFRPPQPLAPSVLQWNGGTVQRLAEDVYEHRIMPADTLDQDRLAVLADALEEAGCTDEAILSHLRGPGPHVRGCWVVDLLTGRE